MVAPAAPAGTLPGRLARTRSRLDFASEHRGSPGEAVDGAFVREVGGAQGLGSRALGLRRRGLRVHVVDDLLSGGPDRLRRPLRGPDLQHPALRRVQRVLQRRARCNAGLCACPANRPASCGLCVREPGDRRRQLRERAATTADSGPARAGRALANLATAPSPTARTTPSPASCVNTDTSGANCGGCGNVCPAAKVCSGGNCTCLAPNTTCFPGTPARSAPNTQTDPENCGTCGTPLRRRFHLLGRNVPADLPERARGLQRKVRRHPDRSLELRELRKGLRRRPELRGRGLPGDLHHA